MATIALWRQIAVFAFLIIAILAGMARIIYRIMSGTYDHEENIEFKPMLKEVSDDNDNSSIG